MFLIRKILILFFFLLSIPNSFGAMVTYVQDEAFLHGPGDTGKQSRFLNGIHFNKDGTKLFTTYNFKPTIGGTAATFQFVHEYKMQEEVPMDLSFEVLDLTLQCETLKSKAVVLSHDKSKSADKLKEVCSRLYVIAHEYAPEVAILHASMSTIRSSQRPKLFGKN